MNDNNSTNADPILGTAEAAKWADVSEDTIRSAIASGRLRASRPGGGTRGHFKIRQSALEAWLNASQVVHHDPEDYWSGYWKTPAPGSSPFEALVEPADGDKFLVDVHVSRVDEYTAARAARAALQGR